VTRSSTAPAAISLLAPGARVEVRDEDWLITRLQQTKADGLLVRALGLSELVRDQEATFFTNLDDVKPLRPEDTKLVHDDSPGFRRGRLYLEALLRRTPLPITEVRPAIGHRQLLDPLDYQKRAVALALEQPRPRLLIADAVGLGKTLEVGMILSELIRRGRGERILVVTPKHILEQFQHELWTRFCLPLVRLDSQGVQRVRQKIPPTRNPFSFYKRVIVSIDTLKNPGQYGHHLERTSAGCWRWVPAPLRTRCNPRWLSKPDRTYMIIYAWCRRQAGGGCEAVEAPARSRAPPNRFPFEWLGDHMSARLAGRGWHGVAGWDG